jgi:hypothetical protein
MDGSTIVNGLLSKSPPFRYQLFLRRDDFLNSKKKQHITTLPICPHTYSVYAPMGITLNQNHDSTRPNQKPIIIMDKRISINNIIRTCIYAPIPTQRQRQCRDRQSKKQAFRLVPVPVPVCACVCVSPTQRILPTYPWRCCCFCCFGSGICNNKFSQAPPPRTHGRRSGGGGRKHRHVFPSLPPLLVSSYYYYYYYLKQRSEARVK